MAQFEPYKEEIARAGSLAFIAAEKSGGVFRPQNFLKKNPSSFPFLLDEDRRVTRTYGVYMTIGMDGFNIARPATFLVGHRSNIELIHVGSTQFDRAPMELVMEAFRKDAAS